MIKPKEIKIKNIVGIFFFFFHVFWPLVVLMEALQEKLSTVPSFSFLNQVHVRP